MGVSERLDTMSSREIEVLVLTSGGCTTCAVASRLGISAHTVKHHLASVRRKLGVRSTLQAVLICLEGGLFDTKPSEYRKARVVTNNCEEFCEVCRHGVYSLAKHLQTEEHRRNVRRDKEE